MVYRPQANNTAERMLQTLTRAMKMYVTDVDQKYENEYAERMTYAVNTVQECIRGDSPFYWIQGLD